LKWSELTYSNFYIPYDENQKAIRGFLLTTLGINLEEIPFIFNEPFNYYENNEAHKHTINAHKVFLNEIIGTSYAVYGGMEIMMLAEIAYNYSYAYDEDYDFSYWPFDDIGKKYWLNAKVRIIK